MKNKLAWLVLAMVAGCQTTEPATEIILEMSTDIPVPAGMDTLSLKIGPQTTPQKYIYSYPLGPGQLSLPRRMTLVPGDVSAPISVLVEGLLGPKTVVSRLVLTNFVKGESKLLQVALLQKCAGQVCPNNQTCTPSAFCADPRLDPAGLPAFDPKKAPVIPSLNDGGVSQDAPGDSRFDGLPGRDGTTFDLPPDSDQVARSDGQAEPDGAIVGPDAASRDDVPGSVVIPDAPVEVDGSPVVKSDTGVIVDAPLVIPDVPPSKRTKGVACAQAGECESGLCIDGVCCEGTCDGLCMACNVPGKLGTCAPVPLNEPSGGDCADDGVRTCGRNGRCNGQGGCMMYPSGLACSDETCPAGSSAHTRAGLCDGQGHCTPGQAQDCTPFLCNATSKTCNLNCASDTDCVAPNRCENNSCGKKGNGQPCAAAGECQSNVCSQGVCCAGACNDLCKSCAVDGALGTCTALPAGKPDLQSRCPDQGVATCGSNGLCDGAGACQKYGNGLTCASKCDEAAAVFTTSTCGAGVCSAGPGQSCAPYSCDASGCKKSCTVPADCAPGFVCGSGGLCVRPPEDCMNGMDDDADGVVDCADPDCAPGFMCVPTVPDGFKGPVELFDGPEANMPTCGGSYPVDHFKGWGSLQCPAATCSPCNCGEPKNVTCSNPAVGFYTTTSCMTRPTPIADEDLNKCTGPSTITFAAFAALAGKANGGTCEKFGGDPVLPLPPITWNAARVCGAPNSAGGGCGQNSICWPRPQNAYRAQACIMGAGNLACPSSGYTKKNDYFESPSVEDTRACTNTCDCATPTGMSCPSTLEMFSAPERGLPCSALYRVGDPVKIPSDCGKTPGSFSHVRVNVPIPSFAGGSCARSGTADPSGTCTPTGNQTTVCCTP